jgi:hypothetical protein
MPRWHASGRQDIAHSRRSFRPLSMRAASIARDPTCERAASARSRKFACRERPRRVRTNVIRGDGTPPGLMPRTTVLRVPPYATRQRQRSSERQISRRANPEGSGRYWWRITGGRLGGYQASRPGTAATTRDARSYRKHSRWPCSNNQRMLSRRQPGFDSAAPARTAPVTARSALTKDRRR